MSIWIVIGTALYLLSQTYMTGTTGVGEPSFFNNGSFVLPSSTYSSINDGEVTFSFQTFSLNSNPVTPQIKVSFWGNYNLVQPRILYSLGTFSDGSFAYAWRAENAILLALFNNESAPASNQINIETLTELAALSITTWPNSEQFLLSWLTKTNVYCQLFTGAVSNTSIFSIPQFKTVTNYEVLVKDDQYFVIGWASNENSQYYIYTQAYYPNGNVQGENIPVTSSSSNLSGVSLANLPNNEYIITWGTPNGAQGEIFDSNSESVGKIFSAGSGLSCSQYNSSVASWAQGSFAIFINCMLQNTESTTSYMQAFYPGGIPNGNLEEIPWNITPYQNMITIQSLHNGSMMILFENSTSSYYQILSPYNCSSSGPTCVNPTHCNTENFECVQCLNQEECPAKTFCSKNQTCVSCLTSTTCPTTQPYCARGNCFQCEQNSECTNAADLFCHNGECVGCQTNKECSQYPLNPYCNQLSGKCVQCMQSNNSECTRGSELYCNRTQCIQCIKNSECTSTKNCINGTCVSCSTNTECQPDGLVCNKPSGVCVECLNNLECSNEYCNTTSNQCVQCLNNTNCPTGELCINGNCTLCTSNSQCEINDPDYKYCNWNGQCLQCENNTECGNFEFCVKGQCEECISDQNCTNSPNLLCKTGHCSTCSLNSDCHNAPGNANFCNTENGLCVLCLLNGECTNNEECCQVNGEATCLAKCPKPANTMLYAIIGGGAVVLILIVWILVPRICKRKVVLIDEDNTRHLIEDPPEENTLDNSMKYLGNIERLRASSETSVQITDTETIKNNRQQLKSALVL